jgi:hypothetical protein
MAAARAARVGARIELEAQRRRRSYTREVSRARDCDCDARFEKLEAALYIVFRLADEAWDIGALAVERHDAA